MPLFTLAIILIVLLLLAIAAMGFTMYNREKQTQVLREQVASREEALRGAAARTATDAVRIESLMREIEADKLKSMQVQDAFRAEFRVLANNIFEEKNTQFKQTNKESLELLLRPFRESIGDFKSRVEQIYASENSQRGELKAEIKNLLDQTNKITTETTALTRALRGDSKTQGDWGEMVLETILESCGLIRGEQYTVQQNVKDAEGNNLRPDVVVNLPEGKRIVVDSKVSLTAFVNYCSCEDDAGRRLYADEHVRSVRNHLRGLGAKNYQEQVAGSPDFVVMFIPNEPAFLAAVHYDSALLSDAYARGVIVAGPTSLFPILKIAHDLWERDNQTRNAREIAKAGAGLYDKLMGFLETMQEMGRNLDNAQKSYRKAVDQLREGRGSLVNRSVILSKLGVKASKKMPGQFAGFYEADGEEGELTQGNDRQMEGADESMLPDGD